MKTIQLFPFYFLNEINKTEPNKIYNHTSLRQLARKNIEIDEIEINKELFKKGIILITLPTDY